LFEPRVLEAWIHNHRRVVDRRFVYELVVIIELFPGFLATNMKPFVGRALIRHRFQSLAGLIEMCDRLVDNGYPVLQPSIPPLNSFCEI
jgi:hypothetical protein